MRISTVLFNVALVVCAYYLVGITYPAPRLSSFPVNHQRPFNFGPDQREDDGQDDKITPFKIAVPDHVLQDLKVRLSQTRSPPPSYQGITWENGISYPFANDLLAYWRDDFNWRAQEEFLNSHMPQFTTKIDGLVVHFAHVKADRGKYGKVSPLLLIHGWPGSFFEFSKVVDPLSRPSDLQEVAFDLVIPTIPGFGFSETPTKSGFSTLETAAVFIKLMARLGYTKYVVQGGDWGSFISVGVAQLDEEHCIGLHLNWFPNLGSPLLLPFRLLIGAVAPGLILSDEREQKKVFPLLNLIQTVFEIGYLVEQGTKPDTLAHSLADSPAGLATWIAEKFHGWSYHEQIDEIPFTKDELLTNIMIYWVNNAGATSIRYYREFLLNPVSVASAAARVQIPTGLADFKKELLRGPRPWVSYKYTNISSFSSFSVGGHFAALEEPFLLSKDIRTFVTRLS